MSQIRSVLIVGATGGVGKPMAFALSKELDYFTRVGVYYDTSRPATTSKQEVFDQFRAAGLEIVEGHGYDSPEPFRGFDCVMLLVGTAAVPLQPQMISTALAAGVRHFYPSEFGADMLAGHNATQRYYRAKLQTRSHLEQKSKEYPNLGWTIIINGRITEYAVTRHFGIDNATATARVYGTPEGRQSLLALADVVAYTLATLKIPLAAASSGGARTYRLHGSTPSWAELFAVLSRVTGRNYEVTYLPVAAAEQAEREAKARGDEAAEMRASHQLVQGREGTVVEGPWDNGDGLFAGIEPVGVEEALGRAFGEEGWRRVYGVA